MISITMLKTTIQSSSVPYRSEASDLFDKMLSAGSFHRFICIITRRSSRLLDLNCISSEKKYGHYDGLREIPLNEIRGTEGRTKDFDDQFHPLSARTRERWVSVARAIERGLSLPPVELIKAGDVYFVRDGHHRISVAHAFGQMTITASVTIW